MALRCTTTTAATRLAPTAHRVALVLRRLGSASFALQAHDIFAPIAPGRFVEIGGQRQRHELAGTRPVVERRTRDAQFVHHLLRSHLVIISLVGLHRVIGLIGIHVDAFTGVSNGSLVPLVSHVRSVAYVTCAYCVNLLPHYTRPGSQIPYPLTST